MEKKILIIGPIGDRGGREGEVGLIVKTLSKNYDVFLCSTLYISLKSQVFDFVPHAKFTSFRQYLFNNFIFIRICALFSYYKNKKVQNAAFYTKNKINKKYLGAEKKIEIYFQKLISQSDLVFVCAQLSSSYLNEIIEFALVKKKPVIFRTTGKISPLNYINNIHYNWIKKVSLFIHHSKDNASQLDFIENYNFSIIDQCAYYESNFLKIPPVQKKIKIFLTYARLVREKNIDIVIEAFKISKKEGDKLIIIGDGPELEYLIKLANDDNDISFPGFISNIDLFKFLSIVDCVIISRYEQETGPLTGIEAMASARILISSKTGAMPERLSSLGFWYDSSVDELAEQINAVKNLSKNQTFELSKKIRERYISEYSRITIEKKYEKVVDGILLP